MNNNNTTISHIIRLTSCNICTNQFTDPISTRCLHTFCTECLKNWINKTHSCPECNQEPHPLHTHPLIKHITNASKNVIIHPSDPYHYTGRNYSEIHKLPKIPNKNTILNTDTALLLSETDSNEYPNSPSTSSASPLYPNPPLLPTIIAYKD